MGRRYYNREVPTQDKPEKERIDYSGIAKRAISSLISYLQWAFAKLVTLVKWCFATNKRLYCVLAVVAGVVIIAFVSQCDCGFVEGGADVQSEGELVKNTAVRLKPYYGYFKSNRHLNSFFKDLNDKHISAAKMHGIPLGKVSGELDEIVSKYDLELIKDCRYYEVDRLTHSEPYLVDKAADLLMDIGKNFKDSLASKGYPHVKPIVTSVFRTPASVKRLQRSGNVNSSSNSAHLYATTIDITYSRFEGAVPVNYDPYKYILAEVLRDLRNDKRCYVKFELKQACFHITVR